MAGVRRRAIGGGVGHTCHSVTASIGVVGQRVGVLGLLCRHGGVAAGLVDLALDLGLVVDLARRVGLDGERHELIAVGGDVDAGPGHGAGVLIVGAAVADPVHFIFVIPHKVQLLVQHVGDGHRDFRAVGVMHRDGVGELLAHNGVFLTGGLADGQGLELLLPGGGVDDIAFVVGVVSAHHGVDRGVPALEGVGVAVVVGVAGGVARLKRRGRVAFFEAPIALVGEHGLANHAVGVGDGVGGGCGQLILQEDDVAACSAVRQHQFGGGVATRVLECALHAINGVLRPVRVIPRKDRTKDFLAYGATLSAFQHMVKKVAVGIIVVAVNLVSDRSGPSLDHVNCQGRRIVVPLTRLCIIQKRHRRPAVILQGVEIMRRLVNAVGFQDLIEVISPVLPVQRQCAGIGILLQ